MTLLAFLDIEATSLARPFSPTPGEVWEVGLILRDQHGETEYRWLLPVTLEHADPESLRISGFHDRHPQGAHMAPGATDPDLVKDLPQWAEDFAALTHGAHLIGNVISFDEERLAALLMAHGVKPGWHYHVIDIESMAAGCLSNRARVRRGLASSPEDVRRADALSAVAHPRWDSEDLSAALRVTPPGPDQRHTALGDARWVVALFDAVMGGA